MADRRYDEKEVSSLIKRAAQLQAEASEYGPDQPTLNQVQQAASELGIRPEFLDQAAAELSVGRKKKGFLGGQVRTRRSVTVPGRMTAERWPMALERLREETGRVGTPSQVGDAFEWISKQPDGLHVSIVPDGLNTRVSILSEISEWAGLYIVFPMFLAMPLTACLWKFLGSFGFILGMIVMALSLIAGRYKFSRIADQRAVQVDRLMQIIESQTALEAVPPLAIREAESSIRLLN